MRAKESIETENKNKKATGSTGSFANRRPTAKANQPKQLNNIEPILQQAKRSDPGTRQSYN